MPSGEANFSIELLGGEVVGGSKIKRMLSWTVLSPTTQGPNIFHVPRRPVRRLTHCPVTLPPSLPSAFTFSLFPFSLPVGVAKGPKGTQRRRLRAVPSFEGAQTNGRRRSMPKSDKVLPLPAAAPPSPIPPRLNFSRSPTFRSLEEKSQHGEPVHLGSMGRPC